MEIIEFKGQFYYLTKSNTYIWGKILGQNDIVTIPTKLNHLFTELVIYENQDMVEFIANTKRNTYLWGSETDYTLQRLDNFNPIIAHENNEYLVKKYNNFGSQFEVKNGFVLNKDNGLLYNIYGLIDLFKKFILENKNHKYNYYFDFSKSGLDINTQTITNFYLIGLSLFILTQNKVYVFGKNDQFQLGLGHNKFVDKETFNQYLLISILKK